VKNVSGKKQSKLGAIAGDLGGLASGLTAWLVTAKTLYGEITVATTGSSYATLAGNMADVLIELFLIVVIPISSLIILIGKSQGRLTLLPLWVLRLRAGLLVR
jgi:hypothetical protein